MVNPYVKMGIVKIHTYQKRRNEAHPGFSCVFYVQEVTF